MDCLDLVYAWHFSGSVDKCREGKGCLINLWFLVLGIQSKIFLDTKYQAIFDDSLNHQIWTKIKEKYFMFSITPKTFPTPKNQNQLTNPSTF